MVWEKCAWCLWKAGVWTLFIPHDLFLFHIVLLLANVLSVAMRAPTNAFCLTPFIWVQTLHCHKHTRSSTESHPSHPLGPGVPSFSGFTGLPSQRRLSFWGATVYSEIFLQTSGSVFSFYHIHVCLVLGYFTRCDHLEIDWSRRFLFEQQQQVSKSSPFF